METAHRHFDEELKELLEQVLRMGALVREQIADSIEAFTERDVALAQRTIANDDRVDTMDVEIEENCVRLLALYQPEARDLRLITAAIKICADLERMSDLSADICERAIELTEEPQLHFSIHLPQAASHAQRMVEEALQALVNQDGQMARKVCADDRFLDDATNRMFQELLTQMAADPDSISRAVRLSFVVKYLERIGDHATNVAERVIYLVEGKIFRRTQMH